MCNSGVGLTPRVGDRSLHFSAGGLYNGVVLLIDDETHTYWDHISGEALHGELTGQRMRRFPIRHTTAKAALTRYPELEVVLSDPGVLAKIYGLFLSRRSIGTKGFILPGFRGTMGKLDERLPDRTQGLGVVVDETACFFPSERLSRPATVVLAGRQLRITMGPRRRRAHRRAPRRQGAALPAVHAVVRVLVHVPRVRCLRGSALSWPYLRSVRRPRYPTYVGIASRIGSRRGAWVSAVMGVALLAGCKDDAPPVDEAATTSSDSGDPITSTSVADDTGSTGAGTEEPAPTWHQDVAPTVVAKCAGCHQRLAGSLRSRSADYEAAMRRGPAMLADAVESGTMPPFAADRLGNECQMEYDWRDDLKLSEEEKEDAAGLGRRRCAPEGDPAAAAPIDHAAVGGADRGRRATSSMEGAVTIGGSQDRIPVL